MPQLRLLCSQINIFLKKYWHFALFIYLAASGPVAGMQDLQLQHVGSSSLTRDRTRVLCFGSWKS